MHGQLLTHMFAELVKRVGGVDAAAAAIEASVGHPVSRGTVSKIQNGKAEPVYSWVRALEDATGNYPFSNLRSRELSGRPVRSAMVGHIEVMIEAAEAVAALAKFEDDETDPVALAQAIKEMSEAHEHTGAALDHLRQRADATTFKRSAA